MDLVTLLAGTIVVSLTIYTLTGGADYGGGIWDLFARGPRGPVQRKLIAASIGPIWEAHHVWLILALVLLFVVFPVAFSTISIALHVPLTLLLIGIVLRGIGFVFRGYGESGPRERAFWGALFSISSVVTPFMLGVSVAAIASGRIPASPDGSTEVWLHPFGLAVGALLTCLVAQLAAVYLAVAAEQPGLQDDFRRRAIVSGIASGLLAWSALLLSRGDAPALHEALLATPRGLAYQVATAAIAAAGLGALWRRRLRWARTLIVVQVCLVIWGWAVTQLPWILPGTLLLHDGVAPASVQRSTVGAVVVGLAVVLPSFFWLYSLFLRRAESGSPHPRSAGAAPTPDDPNLRHPSDTRTAGGSPSADLG